MYLNNRSEPFVLGRDNVNSPNAGLQVICAWPVSGQYGAGTRIAYYILIATAMFLRKAEKLQEAALAAVLVFPAVAGIHGIVLAAVHVDGAVDLDVFAAFQLCAIGLIANSFTYSTQVGQVSRNINMALIGIMSGGLFAIAVEFFRASPVYCTHDDDGRALSTNVKDFPYEHAACGLLCATEVGPVSAIRRGTAKEVFVVPVPNKLRFGAGIVISSGCCIYATIRLSSLWFNMFVRVRKRRMVVEDHPDNTGEFPRLTNKKVQGLDNTVKRFLQVVEFPVSVSFCLALIILGELNFFTPQMTYQTEPFVTIGQWGPVVGIILGLLGPLYVVLSEQPANYPPEKANNYPQIPGEASTHNPTRRPPPYTSPRSSLDLVPGIPGSILELLPRPPPSAFPRPGPNSFTSPTLGFSTRPASNSTTVPNSGPIAESAPTSTPRPVSDSVTMLPASRSDSLQRRSLASTPNDDARSEI